MNKEEAIKSLDDGKTLTHHCFTSDEWVRGIGAGMYMFEDGCKCTASEFWAFRRDSAFDSGWKEFF